MHTATCDKCPKTFTKPTQWKADSALRMHVGRSHSGIIKVPKGSRGNGAIQRKESKMRGRNLAIDEVTALVDFIRTHRGEFPTKMACFKAALKATGIENKIRPGSTAVVRYFAKADKLGKLAPVAEQEPEVKVKRKYTKSKLSKLDKPNGVTCFCPICGSNIVVSETMIIAKRL